MPEISPTGADFVLDRPSQGRSVTTTTGVCKNMNNRNPNPASKLRSARGCAFSQPIACIFTQVGTVGFCEKIGARLREKCENSTQARPDLAAIRVELRTNFFAKASTDWPNGAIKIGLF